MKDEAVAKGYCITCPKCGAVMQRAYETDAILVCRECHNTFYAFMEEGFIMIFPACWLEDEERANRMKAGVVYMGFGKGRIKYKPIPDPFHKFEEPIILTLEEEDRVVISMIRQITKRGNNAEIKRHKDGSLKVIEVKKNIAI